MDGKIRLRHALVAILIGGIAIACGIFQGKKEIAEPTEPNIIIEIIRQEPFPVDAEDLIDDPNIIAENIANTPPPPTSEYDDILRRLIGEPNDVALVVEWETVVMNVSAYCPCKECCENFADGITASGKVIQKGDVFVAAPRKYAFGTEMIIPDYAGGKIVKVEDVGGAIKGNRLDVFFYTHKEALEYGRKEELSVKVRIK